MISTIKNIAALASISRFYVTISILTLILWVASFQQLENILTEITWENNSPEKTESLSLNMGVHVKEIHQKMKGIKQAQTKEQINTLAALVDKHEADILNELLYISQYYLDEKDTLHNFYQRIINWKLIRQELFNAHMQNLNKLPSKQIDFIQVEQQNNKQVIQLQNEIKDIIKLTDNKAKIFNKSKKSYFTVIDKIAFTFIFFLLAMQLFLFRMFKNNSINEKNEVLKALNWSNQLIDSSPDAMVITTQDGNITQVNITAEKLFGYTRAEFIGLNISELMPKRFINHQEKIHKFFDHYSTRAMGQGRDLFAVKKSGEEFQVEISLNLAELNNNKVAITSIRDVTKQKCTELKVLHQANYDFLTQLPNRFLSLDRLSTAIKYANRNNNKLAIMYVDLDDFKKANDIFGHQMGDKILVSTAERLKSVLRTEDTVGRLGGDEFFVLINSFSSQNALIKIGNKILESLKEPFSFGSKNTLLSASIGVSIYPDDGSSVEDLLVNADLSMYHSKHKGKNSFTFFENSMRNKLNRQSSIEEELKGSLDRNEFYVVYQPKYEICSNVIIGFEALVRWDNAEFRDAGPSEFIPILEQIGLINEVGLFVLNNALKTIKKWQLVTQRPLQVAVNISPIQFNDPMLFQYIQEALAKYELTGHALEIEITEGILLEATKEVKDTLNDMRKADIGIALDDFGTGYSSLRYIKDYPINSIKIDRSFIEEINKNKTHTTLVKAIVSLAHSLDFHVTAEGIECKEQLAYLKEIKCDVAQGFYLSCPLSEDKIMNLL